MSLPLIVWRGAPEWAFGDLYFAFGSRSVKEKMFLLRRIVLSMISFSMLSSPELGMVDPD